ncbi:MAG: alanyl-tRNA editing protein [Bryobacteraceae bacterium]|nr:alanyl-tRNA editing protein [Bryobacteraceae bacterium]MDW8378007.1 alanyl-tRNA editing protein [Bryobacterales bacterium]
MTDRLYYRDARLREFTAQVVESLDGGRRIYLDRTAFYPTSGGQPHDTGTLGGVAVTSVIDEGDRIAHLLSEPLTARSVTGQLDWPRRFDHMQQHTGQHLLSAVLEQVFQIPTVSFHLGAESSTIDIQTPSFSPQQMRELERRANEVIWENRRVSVSFEDAAQVQGLRKATERQGLIRIVTIEDLDRSACGGTHVEATGMIGALVLRRLDRIRGMVRLEFLCGARALARARADFETLSEVAKSLSASLDETPALVVGLNTRVRELEKAYRKLEFELASARGKQLYQSAEAGSSGRRRSIQSVDAIDESLRALAQGFTSEPCAVFLACCENSSALLLAVSKDTGLHAGELLKTAAAGAGGRGGGNAQLAQGSAPPDCFADFLKAVLEATA